MHYTDWAAAEEKPGATFVVHMFSFPSKTENHGLLLLLLVFPPRHPNGYSAGYSRSHPARGRIAATAADNNTPMHFRVAVVATVAAVAAAPPPFRPPWLQPAASLSRCLIKLKQLQLLSALIVARDPLGSPHWGWSALSAKDRLVSRA
jgi:hypothetical protein